jgi:anti-sigma factor RsiW
MEKMETMTNNCTGMNEKLADLLFDPAAVPAKVQAHVAECDNCKAELAELKATMSLLDEWKAPEASPYFMTRMQTRMREEREAEPTGWLARQIARMRAGFSYGPVGHLRPLGAMALTVMLLIGGGTYLGVTDWNHPVPPPPAQTAVVHDLQLLDSNQQILDQLASMSDDKTNGD